MNQTDPTMLFVLHPRDISIEISDVAPHAVTEAVYTSVEGVDYLATILLKRWRDRLFFRTRYELDMVFAITEPCLDTEVNLISFFHRNYNAGKYGRYFANDVLPCTLISARDGVWVHDWIGGPWFQMEFLPENFIPDIDLLMWDEGWFGSLQLPQQKLNSERGHAREMQLWLEKIEKRYKSHGQMCEQMRQKVLDREFSPEELIDLPETWVRGSREQATRLVRACCVMRPLLIEWGQPTEKAGVISITLDSATAIKSSAYGPRLECSFGLKLLAWRTLSSVGDGYNRMLESVS